MRYQNQQHRFQSRSNASVDAGSPAVETADDDVLDAGGSLPLGLRNQAIRREHREVQSQVREAVPMGFRHRTIDMPREFAVVAPKTFLTPYRKFGPILMLAGAMTMGGASAVAAPKDRPHQGEVAESASDLRRLQLRDEALRAQMGNRANETPEEASARRGAMDRALGRTEDVDWKRHAAVVLGFAVLGAAVRRIRGGLAKLAALKRPVRAKAEDQGRGEPEGFSSTPVWMPPEIQKPT